MKTRKPSDDQTESSSTNSTDLSTISNSKEPEEGIVNHIDFKRTKNLTTRRQRSATFNEPEDVVLTSK